MFSVHNINRYEVLCSSFAASLVTNRTLLRKIFKQLSCMLGFHLVLT